MASLAAAAALAAIALPPAAEARFEERPLPGAPAHKYFDLGLADVDLDGDLDVYSTNHNFRAMLLVNDGSGGLSDATAPLGYSPMPQLPGMEDMFAPPEPSEPGLYLYATNSGRPGDGRGLLVLRTIGLEGGARVEVGFTERRVATTVHGGAEAGETRRAAGFGARVEIEAGADSLVSMRPEHMDLPVRVRVSDHVPLEMIRVGSRQVVPPANGFDLRFRDRHGVAWADFDLDGSQDAFISAGGLSSEIGSYEAVVTDELLLGGGARPAFADAYRQSRLAKGSCRSREALALDFDLDGVTDLFVGCEQARPVLAMGRGNGRFRQRGRRVRAVAVEQAPAYRWLELDGEYGLELAVAHADGLRTYSFDGDALAPSQDLRGRHDRGLGGVDAGDFDRDGDPDLIVSSAGGVTLYTNRRGELTPRDPRKLGLPGAKVRATSWIDFDNDGRLDLHAHPRGLYRQTADGSFERTGFLRVPRPDGEARVSWGDLDADGTLEPIWAARERDRNDWDLRRWDNTGRARNWIAFDVGEAGGEASSLGARVEIRTRDGRQTSWVGAMEGARFSSGHRRVHFGLGPRRRVERVAVRWPDGERLRVRDPEVGEVHVLCRGGTERGAACLPPQQR